MTHQLRRVFPHRRSASTDHAGLGSPAPAPAVTGSATVEPEPGAEPSPPPGPTPTPAPASSPPTPANRPRSRTFSFSFTNRIHVSGTTIRRPRRRPSPTSPTAQDQTDGPDVGQPAPAPGARFRLPQFPFRLVQLPFRAGPFWRDHFLSHVFMISPTWPLGRRSREDDGTTPGPEPGVANSGRVGPDCVDQTGFSAGGAPDSPNQRSGTRVQVQVQAQNPGATKRTKRDFTTRLDLPVLVDLATRMSRQFSVAEYCDSIGHLFAAADGATPGLSESLGTLDWASAERSWEGAGRKSIEGDTAEAQIGASSVAAAAAAAAAVGVSSSNTVGALIRPCGGRTELGVYPAAETGATLARLRDRICGVLCTRADRTDELEAYGGISTTMSNLLEVKDSDSGSSSAAAASAAGSSIVTVSTTAKASAPSSAVSVYSQTNPEKKDGDDGDETEDDGRTREHRARSLAVLVIFMYLRATRDGEGRKALRRGVEKAVAQEASRCETGELSDAKSGAEDEDSEKREGEGKGKGKDKDGAAVSKNGNGTAQGRTGCSSVAHEWKTLLDAFDQLFGLRFLFSKRDEDRKPGELGAEGRERHDGEEEEEEDPDFRIPVRMTQYAGNILKLAVSGDKEEIGTAADLFFVFTVLLPNSRDLLVDAIEQVLDTVHKFEAMSRQRRDVANANAKARPQPQMQTQTETQTESAISPASSNPLPVSASPPSSSAPVPSHRSYEDAILSPASMARAYGTVLTTVLSRHLNPRTRPAYAAFLYTLGRRYASPSASASASDQELGSAGNRGGDSEHAATAPFLSDRSAVSDRVAGQKQGAPPAGMVDADSCAVLAMMVERFGAATESITN